MPWSRLRPALRVYAVTSHDDHRLSLGEETTQRHGVMSLEA